MGSIEETRIAVEITRLKKGTEFTVFPTEVQLTDDGSIRWSGSLADFVEFARKVGVKTLYLSEWGEDSDHPEREPEGDLEVGFLLDGRMHVFSTVAREESEAPVEEDAGEELVKFLNDNRPGLVKAVCEDVLRRPEVGWSTAAAISSLLRQRLPVRLAPESSIHSLASDTSPAGLLLAEIETEILRAVQERERPIVEALYPKWLDFARQIGLHVLGQADLDVFLGREKSSLTRDGRQSMWTRAKVDLRAEKTAEKLEKGRSKRRPGE